MRSTLMATTLISTLALSSGLWAQTSSSPSQEQQEAVVTREQAEEIALARVPGRVEEVETEIRNGQEMWEVTVETEDGEDYEVVIDSITGQIVEVDS